MIKRLKEKETEPITYQMGEKLKQDINAVAYCECSAKTQKGLKEAFNQVIGAVLDKKEDKKKPVKKSGGGGGCNLI
jgi:GTPase SAR1 family protein